MQFLYTVKKQKRIKLKIKCDCPLLWKIKCVNYYWMVDETQLLKNHCHSWLMKMNNEFAHGVYVTYNPYKQTANTNKSISH